MPPNEPAPAIVRLPVLETSRAVRPVAVVEIAPLFVNVPLLTLTVKALMDATVTPEFTVTLLLLEKLPRVTAPPFRLRVEAAPAAFAKIKVLLPCGFIK